MRREIAIATSDLDYGMLLARYLRSFGADASIIAKPTPAAQQCTQDPTQHDVLILDSRDDPGAFAYLHCVAARQIIFLHSSGGDGQEKPNVAGAIHFSSPIDPQVLISALDGPALESAHRESAILSYAGIDVDLARMKVQVFQTPLHVPPIQYRLLVQMMLAPEKVIMRRALIAAVWPNRRFVEGKTLNIHMGRLRSTLRRASGRELIRCVRGAGYAIELKRLPASPSRSTPV